MKPRTEIGFITLLALISVAFLSSHTNVVRAEQGDGCDLPGKDHKDNNPSKKEFLKLAYSGTLCEIAICVDIEKCTNHTKVDWDKFTKSPAYINAEEEEQKAMDKAHKHGTGADGLVGYEIMDYVVKDSHHNN